MKMLPEFGQDPMDQYSLPLDSETTSLAILLQLNARESPKKPGRSLVVEHDSRKPLVHGFEMAYSYTVTFSKIGNRAGNHLHRLKQEIMRPVVGRVRILLEEPDAKLREKFVLNANTHQALYVRPGIAHVVIADSNPAVLLVQATYPNNEADEFSYQIAED